MKKRLSCFIMACFMVMFTACGAAKDGNGKVDENASYRVIKMNSFQGEVNLTRGGSSVDVIQGMNLESGDKVETKASSMAELIVDSDKHIGVHENTGITINASGTDTAGKVTISLMYGSSLFSIDNKLNDDSEFIVNTPNATLSVRGTVFEVNYDKETNVTTVAVDEGTVWVNTDTEETTLEEGDGAIITETKIENVDADDLAMNIDGEKLFLTGYTVIFGGGDNIMEQGFRNAIVYDKNGELLALYEDVGIEWDQDFFETNGYASTSSKVYYCKGIEYDDYATTFGALMANYQVMPFAGSGEATVNHNDYKQIFYFDDYGMEIERVTVYDDGREEKYVHNFIQKEEGKYYLETLDGGKVEHKFEYDDEGNIISYEWHLSDDDGLDMYRIYTYEYTKAKDMTFY